jgi:hypothetical protein
MRETRYVKAVLVLAAILALGTLGAVDFPEFVAAANEHPAGSARTDVTARATIELIRNGGCEEDLAGGEIPGWTEVLGSNWAQRGSNPDPYEGDHYFFPGVASTAELKQEVDVSDISNLIDAGSQTFDFSGWVRSYVQSPSDQTRIVIEYLNLDQSEVLSSFDSGLYSNTADWLEITNSTIAPAGTRMIRIRLISTRRNGSNNDGYYDGLSLQTNVPVPLSPQELSIQNAGEDILLDWEEVTQDDAGNTIAVHHYNVYAGPDLDFDCNEDTLVGTTVLPGITLTGLAQPYGKLFFKVCAVIYYNM